MDASGGGRGQDWKVRSKRSRRPVSVDESPDGAIGRVPVDPDDGHAPDCILQAPRVDLLDRHQRVVLGVADPAAVIQSRLEEN
jgi:hypothetical protein